MPQYEPSVVEQEPEAPESLIVRTTLRARETAAAPAADQGALERAARSTLRGQIAKLERELSAILAERFPFLPVPEAAAVSPGTGPRLPDLAELERTRDRLAAQVQETRVLARLRSVHERRSRELLKRMQLEPGRYKYVRLPVSDLGEGGCGVWEVRPRLGLIGMLAGWWQLKLSSGCPLDRGSRSKRDPGRRP